MVLDELEADPKEFISKFTIINLFRAVSDVLLSDEFQSARLEQPGASPFPVTFADIGLDNMDDTNYKVFVGGETAAQAQQTSYATTGFTLIGGSIGDIIHVLIVGPIQG
jgi:hypothetical protein